VSEQVKLARRIQQALTDVAEGLSEYASALEAGSGLAGVEAPAPVEVPEARGKRQQEILDLLAADGGEDGIKTSAISRAIDMEQPNTYLTLQSLAKQGLVEKVPGVDPQHWRLAPRFRLSKKIQEVAGLVLPGEWTSYGDISQVVYGHAMGGLAVGQVASRTPNFPNPHRVLQYTGQIPPEWTDREGRTANDCADLLRAEGVEVDRDLFAHGRHHVTHEVLAKRLAAFHEWYAKPQVERTVESLDAYLRQIGVEPSVEG
jgi:alkylated DNA nucleotide flippase Atl1